MAESSGQEKTHQPTPRRKEKAREEGNVPKSQDLGSAAIIIGAILALWLLGPGMGEQIKWAFRAVFINLLSVNLTPDNIADYFVMGGLFVIRLLLPFFLVMIVVGLAIHFYMTGWLFTTKPLKPNFKRIMPQNVLKRIISSRGLVELAKGLGKVAVVGVIAYFILKAEVEGFIKLMDTDVSSIITIMTKAGLKLALWLALAILIIGILDWMFQKWKNTKDLMMTKQEVKDERKQMEGDPRIKGHIRRIQLNLSLNRMIKKIPEADVVVSNPVHLAIALKYNPETNSAPVVVGKGKRKLAEKIKAIARENDIPIIEDPPLARALYRMVDVGWEIPYELFQAVAEVLALVYRLKEAA